MKDAVDTIEMTTNTYSCHRQTRKYPTKLFTNILNVACWNIFVIWMMNNPEWNRGNLAKRRLFLKGFAETLMKPHIRRRSLQPRLQASVRTAMDLCGVNPPQEDGQFPATRGNRADRGEVPHVRKTPSSSRNLRSVSQICLQRSRKKRITLFVT